MSSRIERVMRKILRLPKTAYRCIRAAPSFPRRYREQNDRIFRLEEAQRQSQDKLAAFEVHLPAILNYITSFNHTSRELTRANQELKASMEGTEAWVGALADGVSQLWERIEFVRRETLYELMYGPRAEDQTPKTEAKVINQEKLAAMGDNIRVNLGCGHLPVEGYLNIDQRELPGVDVVAEATDLPFEPGSVSELYSAHLIEHFSQEELKRRVLPHWVELLKPGGTLRAVLPDWEEMITSYARGEYPFDDLREVTFGAQDYDGDFHLNMFSRDSLRQVLKEAGLKEISYPVTGRRNGKSLEMEVTARK
jgi:hypothetical protein